VSVPDGPFLLSLYFFEIDWPQYRAYRIRVLTDEDKPVPVVGTSADNFLKGEYKRFVVLGPAKLLVMINGGRSPDAEISGIFLDALGAPDTQLLDSALTGSMSPTVSPTDGSPDVTLAAKSADDALTLLLATPKETRLQEGYIRQEAAFFNTMQASAQKDPEAYYRNLESRWRAAEVRTATALIVLDGKTTSLAVRLLNYYAAHGRCNYEGARQAIHAAVHDLSVEARNSGERWPRPAQVLQDYAVALMRQGRRGEAEISLRAFTAVCRDLETAEASREKLVLIGKQAVRAGVSLPIAEALSEWESQHGPLSIDDRLLLGNLYYVAGRNDKALAIYQDVEPKLKEGSTHRWVLIAMLTAHLRENRIAEATTVMNRLKAAGASAVEVAEGQYRFGAHYFEVREFDKAKQCFIQLRDSPVSADYKQMAEEYLGRIEQVAKVKQP
jgi:tetratricopeptide (TPR) repeat protein